MEINWTVVAAIAVYIGLVAIIWRQQRTIDRLTDKLMAKDYSEYKRHEKPLMVEEKPRRKPLSFYDDGAEDAI